MRTKLIFKVILLLQAVCVFACSSEPSIESSPSPVILPTGTPELSPSPTHVVPPLVACGENVYSREDDEGILEEYFTYVSPFDFGSGESLAQDQSGMYVLDASPYLAVGYESAFPNHMRLCIQEFDETGKVVFDDLINTDGKGTWTLKPLAPGHYVMRVIVKNMVIESWGLKVSEAARSGARGVPTLASCGENLYSREDEEDILENYFEYVSLFDWRTDEGIVQDRNGNHLLTTDQYLAVNYESAFPNHMRVCIQEFDQRGRVVFDNTINTDGQGTWPLRPLDTGRYVIRVIVKNMVIKSLVLNVAESPSPTSEASTPSTMPGVEITSLNEEWNRYVNRTLGFAIDIPKKMYRYPAECVWKQTGAGTELALEGGGVPVAVIEGSDRVYITSETFIALTSSKHDPQNKVQHSYDICEKQETTLDMLQKSENTSFLWEIALKTIETENDLEELVDDYYGPCFSVGEIKPVEDKEYSTVQVLGDQKPVEESTCLLRGMYIFLYSPDLKNAATWKTGTMVHFSASGLNQEPYDGDMFDSFQFIPRIQED